MASSPPPSPNPVPSSAPPSTRRHRRSRSSSSGCRAASLPSIGDLLEYVAAQQQTQRRQRQRAPLHVHLGARRTRRGGASAEVAHALADGAPLGAGEGGEGAAQQGQDLDEGVRRDSAEPGIHQRQQAVVVNEQEAPAGQEPL